LIAVATSAESLPDAAATAPHEEPIAGYALFRRVLDEAELLRVAVAPAARRHGIAHLLVGRGLRELAADGVRVCFLEVRAGNAAAIALYEALGFALAGRRPGYYPDGETALVFARPLAGFVDPPGGGCYPDDGPPKGGANDAGS
jgi:ribosomal protein S18 acetylase RimI-like enzyme